MPKPRRNDRGKPVLSSTTRPANNPSTRIVYPWRFRLGEWVHVRGHQWHRRTVQVVGGVLHHGFPHLDVRTASGQYWRIPQIHVTAEAVNDQ